MVTVDKIMAKVGKILTEADFPTKSEIMATLLQMVPAHSVPLDSVRDAVYAVLRGADTFPPNYTHKEHEQFVQRALQLLFMISNHDRDFLVELMFAYMEGNEATRYVSAVLLFFVFRHLQGFSFVKIKSSELSVCLLLISILTAIFPVNLGWIIAPLIRLWSAIASGLKNPLTLTINLTLRTLILTFGIVDVRNSRPSV